MVKFKKLTLLFSLVVALMVAIFSFMLPAHSAIDTGAATKLVDAVPGSPISAGNFLFWQDQVSTKSVSIYGFDYAKRTKFLVSDQPGDKLSLTSDGKTLLWISTPLLGTNYDASVMGYDLSTKSSYPILPATGSRVLGTIAFDSGVLYYQDWTLGHTGLFALDVTSKQERFISSNGSAPVVSDGILLWSEQSGSGGLSPSEYSLHLQKVDGTTNDTIIAKGRGRFSSYSISGDNVVWSFSPPDSDQLIHLYSVSKSQSRTISSEAASKTLVKGDNVFWVKAPTGELGKPNLWSLHLYNISGNKTSTVINPTVAKLDLHGIVNQSSVVFSSADDSTTSAKTLRAADSSQRNIQLASSFSQVELNQAVATASVSCGSVFRSTAYPYNGNLLYDNCGRWKVNGVQFVLPQFGINNSTFFDYNYNRAVSDGSLEYWLGLAQNNLLVKNLRIFVDLPETGTQQTSVSTIVDFVNRANNHGMRVGIVFNGINQGTNLTTQRKNFLSSLVNGTGGLSQSGLLPAVSYFNAANEVNHYCGGTADCYHNANGSVNTSYVASWNNWVRDFRNYVKGLNSSILITVGLATELTINGSANLEAILEDFFLVSGGGDQSLQTSVDFLSPHNYGGGGYGIWPYLRYTKGYGKPIVLEEYGFPTDRQNNNSSYKESAKDVNGNFIFDGSGELICRNDPYNSVCQYNTAPYYIEVNARSMRDNNTDGFAGGSAWMLADSNSKDCNSPFDFWTGLFSAGSYPTCGGVRGTYTTTGAGEKATAFRIRTHHFYY